MVLQAAIIEDEKISRELLKKYLKKYCPNVSILAEAENVEKGIEIIRNYELDLVFLDVEMPYGTAFDLLDKVGDRLFETIFVTAYDQYAKEALNQQATYYLTKPIEIDELIKAVDLVQQIKEKEQLATDRLLVKQTPPQDEKITIPTQEGFEVIAVDQIIYCKADDNYTHVILKEGERLVSKTLKHFDELLNDKGFYRIHKSYLINMRYVTAYKKGKGGSVILESTIELPVSPSKKAALLAYFH